MVDWRIGRLGFLEAFAILLGFSQQLHLRRHWFLLYENDANLFTFENLLFVNLAIHGE